MKSAILTYHYIPNIGATLQAYALWKILNSKGLDCEILDYRCSNINKRELVFNSYDKSLIKTIYRKYKFQFYGKRRIKRCQEFIYKNAIVSSQQYNKDTVGYSNKKYDLFISGSDMIWNLNVNGYDYTYFLDFTEADKKRFSYASSISGTWAETDLEEIEKYLLRYDALSMRESDNCEFLKTKLDLDCQWVCDPTMLLPVDEWMQFIKKEEHKKGYVLVYFAYKEILSAAKKYARKYHKKLYVINRNHFCKGVYNYSVYTPEDWITAFANADVVFTDSYHGMLFSLYFHKPFWTNEKSNRVQTVLRLLNVAKVNIDQDPEFHNEINYQQVDRKIENFKSRSERYIDQILRKLKEGDEE